MLEIVQLPLMLLANQNLLQKHAGSFIYAINLNETGYLVLFFLTEKIYEKICLRKGIILGNLILIFFSLTKTRKKPKLEVHCTQQVYWSNSAWFFFSSPLNHKRTICASSKTQQKYTPVRQTPPPPPSPVWIGLMPHFKSFYRYGELEIF